MTDTFVKSYAAASSDIQKQFGKQLGHLARDLHHRSLDAKKFGPDGRWQARVNDAWRFYFRMDEDADCTLLDIIPHPK